MFRLGTYILVQKNIVSFNAFIGHLGAILKSIRTKNNRKVTLKCPEKIRKVGRYRGEINNYMKSLKQICKAVKFLDGFHNYYR